MIELSPIPRKIQQRLLEKMRALGKITRYSDESTTQLSPNDMSSRSTFIKMTSGLENPVVLMGGELIAGTGTTDSEGNPIIGFGGDQLAAGFDDIYGPRPYSSDGFNTSGENKSKRPMPGIKSVDVIFKGGTKAQREATISWTCWSFDDLNRLMPHFLAHGKTVLIEFGWVYRNQPLGDLPSFIDEEGIKREAFGDYSEEVINANGDMDLIVGQIKNFEFTTRADGAFDCQTIVGSIGVNLFSDIKPNSEQQNLEGEIFNIELPTTSINDGGLMGLSSTESSATSLNEKERKQLESQMKRVTTATDSTESSVLHLNTDVTMKFLLKNLDEYIKEKLTDKIRFDEIGFELLDAKDIIFKRKKIDDTRHSIRWIPNKFIAIGQEQDVDPPFNPDFGRGYSTFLKKSSIWVRWGWFEDNVLSKFTAMTSSDSNRPVMEFRSIERNLEGGGDYESVKIKNDRFLQSVDITKYILPNQFSPQEPDNFKISYEKKDGTPSTKEIKLSGDGIHIRTLASIVNDENNFSKFTTSDSKTEGYLRNMLINVNLIKEVFGVSKDSDFNIETLTIDEALTNFGNKLNEKLPFWSFDLREDELETNRVKMVDTQITGVDFDKSISSQKTTYEGGEIFNNGIFEFPVWKETSMVKSQNITAKVPNAMALAVMYGSNLNVVKDFSTTGNQFAESAGTITGGLHKNSIDKSKKNLDFAIRNDFSKNIGTSTGEATEPLTVNGSDDDIFTFLITADKAKLKESYNERVESINDALDDAKIKKQIEELSVQKIDPNAPAPLLDFVEDDVLKKAIFAEAYVNGLAFKEVRSTYNTKYKNGVMKPSFIKSIKYILNANSDVGSKTDDQSVIIPLDMELEIDGIGGIYPGNSFHSSYLPTNYREKTVFQMFDVNHKVDSSGWTTTIGGKMRSSISQIIQDLGKKDDLINNMFSKYKDRITSSRETLAKIYNPRYKDIKHGKNK